jgi:hypothetical protein
MISPNNTRSIPILSLMFTAITIMAFTVSCGVYSFKDVSIPPQVKTIRVGFIENRSRYVDPQLSPLLTDKFKTKISSQTKLVQIQSESADYDVSAYISDYSVSTAGVSNQAASINRLTVTVHLSLKNKYADQKIGTPDFDTDITRIFDFPATQNLNDAQAQLEPQIVSQLSDDMFNRLFSNW